MTTYWKSIGKIWCKYCKVFVTDNKSGRDKHNMGDRHKSNVQRHLDDIRHKATFNTSVDSTLQRDLDQIEQAALAAYSQDIAMHGAAPRTGAGAGPTPAVRAGGGRKPPPVLPPRAVPTPSRFGTNTPGAGATVAASVDRFLKGKKVLTDADALAEIKAHPELYDAKKPKEEGAEGKGGGAVMETKERKPVRIQFGTGANSVPVNDQAAEARRRTAEVEGRLSMAVKKEDAEEEEEREKGGARRDEGARAGVPAGVVKKEEEGGEEEDEEHGAHGDGASDGASAYGQWSTVSVRIVDESDAGGTAAEKARARKAKEEEAREEARLREEREAVKCDIDDIAGTDGSTRGLRIEFREREVPVAAESAAAAVDPSAPVVAFKSRKRKGDRMGGARKKADLTE